MKSGKFAFLLMAMFALGLGAGWVLWGQPPAATPTPQVRVNPQAQRYEIPTEGDPSLGAEDAPITIIEFSDYECPYCARWYNEVLSQLLRDYEGKIRFVYKDFPLKSLHANAVSAAEAAHCAGEQGYYWQFHNALFEGAYGMGNPAYEQYAQAIGADLPSFQQCVQERHYAAEVEEDFQFAVQLGVSSTPKFFLNGLAVVGAQPYSVFQQLIEQELNGARP